MHQKSEAVFETEKKFRCTEIDKLVDHACSLGFIQTQKNIREHDIYFTDKEHIFIEKRICLRIRQTDSHCEITHKGHSQDTGAFYSKLENNIEIAHENKENAISLIESLGFLKYVEIKKVRDIFKKTQEKYTYNIAIDHIENIGYFIEFEILSPKAIEKDQIKIIFNEFVGHFGGFDLQEESLPYRDIVKQEDKIV
ncbi:MAG: class IV adenylate cyclase [candidate division SR1 bacterium]|nr:class IV adenylate cyclase [candidate division SR1 bacterium]